VIKGRGEGRTIPRKIAKMRVGRILARATRLVSGCVLIHRYINSLECRERNFKGTDYFRSSRQRVGWPARMSEYGKTHWVGRQVEQPRGQSRGQSPELGKVFHCCVIEKLTDEFSCLYFGVVRSFLPEWGRLRLVRSRGVEGKYLRSEQRRRNGQEERPEWGEPAKPSKPPD